MLRLAAIIWAAFVLAVAASAAQPDFPKLTSPMVDAAGILSPADAGAIGGRLRAYEISSGHQVAVATVPSLEGYEIRDYGNRLFRYWALGDKTRNDGVLLLVAPVERKVSIEVGYGLEGELTDAVSRVIIENAILPKFKAGDFAGGISAGIDDITKVVAGQGDALIAASKQQQGGSPADVIPPLIFFVLVVFLLYRASRGHRVIFVPAPGWGSRGSSSGSRGWSSGGGWSGGGSSWSGGGGSSGGGGASGRW
jgi:uncharacterized protein